MGTLKILLNLECQSRNLVINSKNFFQNTSIWKHLLKKNITNIILSAHANNFDKILHFIGIWLYVTHFLNDMTYYALIT